MSAPTSKASGPAIMTKAEFAKFRGVTPGRVSHWIAERRLQGSAFVGIGRQARVDVIEAVKQLGNYCGETPRSVAQRVSLRPKGSTKVYVIWSEQGLSKIGIAHDPLTRLKVLRTASPYALHLSYVEDVGRLSAKEVELITHISLRPHHRRGEWFAVSPETARDAVLEAVNYLLKFRPAPP